MKKFLLFLTTFLLLLILGALALNPTKYFELCKQGLLVWALTVVPALLPFLFCTLILCKLCNVNKICSLLNPACKLLYNENGISGYLQFISFISGYPVGARQILEFYEQGIISQKQATKLSTLCSTSGPAFILSTVCAVMLKNKNYAIVLLTCHYLSAIINGIIFKKYSDYRPIPPLFEKNKAKNLLYDCAFSTFTSCLIVGVYIAFFFVLSQILYDLKITYPLVKAFEFLFNDTKKATAFVAGLLECTKGCLMLAETQGVLKLPLICACITFGGASVIVQSLAFLKQAKANGKVFLLSKVIQTVVSFTLCLILCLVFKIS